MQLPRRHKDTNPDSYRDHKEFIFNDLSFVQLRALAPLPTGRQVGGKKILLGVDSRVEKLNKIIYFNSWLRLGYRPSYVWSTF
jgi:hypothetical protein